nr:MAG TPA: hypothetical protein [Bacteriophage sp.]
MWSRLIAVTKLVASSEEPAVAVAPPGRLNSTQKGRPF